MANEPTPQIWYSGDWHKRPNKQVPYNGIKISGLPLHDDNGDLVSIAVSLVDYTVNKQGIKSVIPELTVSAGNVTIIPPISPTSPPSSPPKADSSFTIEGIVTLEATFTNVCLRIRLDYGLEHSKRNEIGYVMCFDSTLAT